MPKTEYKYGKDDKAKIAGKRRRNFWVGKTPCWKITLCPDSIKNECPAPKHLYLPCWMIEGTYCKLDERNESGEDTSVCRLCRVYIQYRGRKPLQIKLFTSSKQHSGLGKFTPLPLSRLHDPLIGQIPTSSIGHSLSPDS